MPGVPAARLAGVAAALVALAGCGPSALPAPPAETRAVTQWPAYGGDRGGARFAALDLLQPDNVARLAPAWTYRHGEVPGNRDGEPRETAFENTPILVGDTLYLCTPFNRVIALDPATGAERWVHDPQIDLDARPANQFTCRGVAAWRDAAAAPGTRCARTIFSATNDARLIALDAATGEPCRRFGADGEVDLGAGVGEQRWKGEYQVTSAPAIAGDVVVVGSAVSDNVRTDAPSGVVRGFDARSGALRWAFDLAPPDYDHAREPTSPAGYALGTPNVWAPMSVDSERDLVFVPTGNAAPDYYRGDRQRMNFYGSSVIALRGSTGERIWHFQTVHADLWDFDVPAQPTLTTIPIGGRPRDALVQATKMGLLFVLDRETGEPLLPIEERPVPGGPAPGERLSPTQPFPITPSLVRDTIGPEHAWGLTPWDRGRCRARIAALRSDGIYTPPSLQGSIMYPGNAGGSNWGGIAVDPGRGVALVRSSDVPWEVRLIPRERFEAERRADPDAEYGPQLGTPFGVRRELLLSPLGLPCVAPPWGTLSAVDLRTGAVRWQVPHGSVRDLAPLPIPLEWGVPGIGGPLATAGGLTFIAAAMDDYLRAYDTATGALLWRARLPAGGQATPMSYRVDFADGSARQYVVIAAGGHARAGTRHGDSLVAFALERRGAPGYSRP